MFEIGLRNEEKVASRLSLLKKYKWQWAVAFMLTTVYLLMLYGLQVPDWEYHIPIGASSGSEVLKVKCGVRGDTGPACNAVGMIDPTVLGIQRMYRKPIYARTEVISIAQKLKNSHSLAMYILTQYVTSLWQPFNSPDYGPLPSDAPSWCLAPFDPEGILSTVMAIVTCLLGLPFGHVIVHFKNHNSRLSLWSYASMGLTLVGLLCHILEMHYIHAGIGVRHNNRLA